MKKKKEIWVITGLLIISITFLMGVLYSSNAFRSNSMMNIINQYPTDYFIESNWNHSEDLLSSYFSNYEGPLEIDHTFRVENVDLDNVKIIGDNISDTGILINQLNRSYNTIFLVAIDEIAYNLLRSDDMNSTVFLSDPLNFSSTGILTSNFFREHQESLTDMRLNIFTEAETREDRDVYPLNLNFTNINSSIENSVSVNGYFEIYDIDFFCKALGLYPSSHFSEYPIFLGNLETINVLFPNSTDEIIHVYSEEITNIVFNKTRLSQYSPTKISLDVNDFDRAIRNFDDYFYLYGRATWDQEINSLTENNMKFQIYSIILFLPIIIICYSYFKISNEYMISKRSREIGMCLVNGMNKKQIKTQYYGAIIFSGLIGGIIGNLSGLILSIKIGEFLFPNIQIVYSDFIASNIILNSFLTGIIAALISFIAIRKPLKQILNKTLENILETKKFELEKQKKIRQLEWILFGGCIYALIFSIIQSLFYESFDMSALYLNPPVIFIAIIIAIPFLPIFVYIFPSLILKISMNKLTVISRKFAEKKIFKKNPFKVKLLFWNWTQKSDRNQKLIEIFSISIIFIFITSSLATSFDYSQTVYESSQTANANKIDMEFLGNTSFTTINKFNSDLSKNLSDYHLKSFNTIKYTSENTERYYDEGDQRFMNDIKILNYNKDDLWYYQFVCFNISNLQNNAEFRDEWFIGGSYNDILTKLQQPDAMLIPSYMLETNFSINDKVNLYYTNDKSEKIYRNATIIGAYRTFPSISKDRYYRETLYREIIVNPQLLENATLKKASYLFYGESDLNDIHLYQLKNLFYRNLPEDFTFLTYFTRSYDIENEFEVVQFKLIKLESFLFVFYMILGIFIHSALSNMNLSYEIGLLKSRGVSKKDLVKLSLSEIHLILVIGFVFSSISLIGIKLLIMFLNIIRGSDIGSTFPLYYQNPKIIDFIGIIVGTVLFYISYFCLNYLQIKKSSASRDLEKILRIT
ncbi:MAG: FtsX-like permease family protein [Promethearchaeota archaeon]